MTSYNKAKPQAVHVRPLKHENPFYHVTPRLKRRSWKSLIPKGVQNVELRDHYKELDKIYQTLLNERMTPQALDEDRTMAYWGYKKKLADEMRDVLRDMSLSAELQNQGADNEMLRKFNELRERYRDLLDDGSDNGSAPPPLLSMPVLPGHKIKKQKKGVRVKGSIAPMSSKQPLNWINAAQIPIKAPPSSASSQPPLIIKLQQPGAAQPQPPPSQPPSLSGVSAALPPQVSVAQPPPPSTTQPGLIARAWNAVTNAFTLGGKPARPPSPPPPTPPRSNSGSRKSSKSRSASQSRGRSRSVKATPLPMPPLSPPIPPSPHISSDIGTFGAVGPASAPSSPGTSALNDSLFSSTASGRPAWWNRVQHLPQASSPGSSSVMSDSKGASPANTPPSRSRKGSMSKSVPKHPPFYPTAATAAAPLTSSGRPSRSRKPPRLENLPPPIPVPMPRPASGVSASSTALEGQLANLQQQVNDLTQLAQAREIADSMPSPPPSAPSPPSPPSSAINQLAAAVNNLTAAQKKLQTEVANQTQMMEVQGQLPTVPSTQPTKDQERAAQETARRRLEEELARKEAELKEREARAEMERAEMERQAAAAKEKAERKKEEKQKKRQEKAARKRQESEARAAAEAAEAARNRAEQERQAKLKAEQDAARAKAEQEKKAAEERAVRERIERERKAVEEAALQQQQALQAQLQEQQRLLIQHQQQEQALQKQLQEQQRQLIQQQQQEQQRQAIRDAAASVDSSVDSSHRKPVTQVGDMDLYLQKRRGETTGTRKGNRLDEQQLKREIALATFAADSLKIRNQDHLLGIQGLRQALNNVEKEVQQAQLKMDAERQALEQAKDSVKEDLKKDSEEGMLDDAGRTDLEATLKSIDDAFNEYVEEATKKYSERAASVQAEIRAKEEDLRKRIAEMERIGREQSERIEKLRNFLNSPEARSKAKIRAARDFADHVQADARLQQQRANDQQFLKQLEADFNAERAAYIESETRRAYFANAVAVARDRAQKILEANAREDAIADQLNAKWAAIDAAADAARAYAARLQPDSRLQQQRASDQQFLRQLEDGFNAERAAYADAEARKAHDANAVAVARDRAQRIFDANVERREDALADQLNAKWAAIDAQALLRGKKQKSRFDIEQRVEKNKQQKPMFPPLPGDPTGQNSSIKPTPADQGVSLDYDSGEDYDPYADSDEDVSPAMKIESDKRELAETPDPGYKSQYQTSSETTPDESADIRSFARMPDPSGRYPNPLAHLRATQFDGSFPSFSRLQNIFNGRYRAPYPWVNVWATDTTGRGRRNLALMMFQLFREERGRRIQAHQYKDKDRKAFKRAALFLRSIIDNDDPDAKEGSRGSYATGKGYFGPGVRHNTPGFIHSMVKPAKIEHIDFDPADFVEEQKRRTDEWRDKYKEFHKRMYGVEPTNEKIESAFPASAEPISQYGLPGMQKKYL